MPPDLNVMLWNSTCWLNALCFWELPFSHTLVSHLAPSFTPIAQLTALRWIEIQRVSVFVPVNLLVMAYLYVDNMWQSIKVEVITSFISLCRAGKLWWDFTMCHPPWILRSHYAMPSWSVTASFALCWQDSSMSFKTWGSYIFTTLWILPVGSYPEPLKSSLRVDS